MQPSPLLFLLVGGLGFVALGIAAVVRGRRESAKAADFVLSAVVAEAEVIDLRLKHHRRRAGRSAAFFPVVRFMLPDGRRVDAETMVGAHPAPARPGERVAVCYDPEDPVRVVLADGRARAGSVGWLWVVFGVSLAASGTFFVLIWILLAVVAKVPL